MMAAATRTFQRLLVREGQFPRGLFVLAAIIVLAAALRIYGLDWDSGYSNTPHPDERAILMKVGELGQPAPRSIVDLFNPDISSWNPRWFPYGSFPLYLISAVKQAYEFVTGRDLHDLRHLGRTISAVADTGTVVFVYLLGSKIFGRREGILAGVLTAMAVLHIQLSHYFTVDTLATFFSTAAMFFLYNVSQNGRKRDSGLAGVVLGLGLATKISIAPIIATLFVAHLVYLVNHVSIRASKKGGIKSHAKDATLGLGIGLGTMLLAFAAAEPYAILDFGRFYSDMVEQSEMVRGIRDYPYTRQYIETSPYWYQASQLTKWGLGWPLGCAAWIGLGYILLRGMNFRVRVAYITIGIASPAILLLWTNNILAIVAVCAISSIGLISTLPMRTQNSRTAIVLLAWVVPYFLITGSFHVKFLRYLLPITPILILFGSMALCRLWAQAGMYKKWPQLGIRFALSSVVLLTGFYAMSYMAVYATTHTAVRTSEWINENAPPQAVILKEHWEEGIPDLDKYLVKELELYDRDSPTKIHLLSEQLAMADYIVFYSNRLYGTIPRLAERYPMTSAYYRGLFDGSLGYYLVNVETRYPGIGGFDVRNNTFRRPDLTPPNLKHQISSGKRHIDLGFADESFTVYDHPLGLVFSNIERMSAGDIRGVIRQGTLTDHKQPANTKNRMDKLMSDEMIELQRAGGTWTDIVITTGWWTDNPVLVWTFVVEIAALLAMPITFVLFRPFADRGYVFSKALGLLAIALLTWLFASFEWLSFSRLSIGISAMMFGSVSILIFIKERKPMLDFLRRKWHIVLVGEVVFLAAFLGFVFVRMANPDLWHPYLGGEKPMDMAYLTAVLKSSYMPPYDPWFAGGYINYYYMGQFIVATIIKATGIVPAVAYNLAVPQLYALTVAGAFSLTFNLVEGTRRTAGIRKRVDGRKRLNPSTLIAAVGGALFVVVIGNLDGAVQLLGASWNSLVLSEPYSGFDFWRSARVMPSGTPGHEITEFPFFTFLFADLHAHLISLPFTLLALGLSIAVVSASTNRGWKKTDDILRLIALGIVVGSLRTINTWDYPTYLIIAIFVVGMSEHIRNGGFNIVCLGRIIIRATAVVSIGYAAFLPFHMNYESFFNSLDLTTNQTRVKDLLVIHGVFVFIIVSFYSTRLASVLNSSASTRSATWQRWMASAMVGFVAGLTILLAIFDWKWGGFLFMAVVLFVVLVGAIKGRKITEGGHPYLTVVTFLLTLALLLAMGLEIFRIEGDVGRMNSVFKFYLQIWVLMGISSAYLLWRLIFRIPTLGVFAKKLWVATTCVLLIGTSIYPVLGTHARLNSRFEPLPLTLDGTAYVNERIYHDAEGDIGLEEDYKGIRWLQENVDGSPVILEGLTPNYRWGGRVSVYTGLPTIIGWQWHQEQQRWGHRDAVAKRVADVNHIYSTASMEEAMDLMRHYGVEYVYLGRIEALYYPKEGLEKFSNNSGNHLKEVFRNQDVRIFRTIY